MIDRELVIPDREVNPRLDSDVERSDSIGCQNENSIIIYQNSEEDCGKCATVHIASIISARFEEHIRFVATRKISRCAYRSLFDCELQ